MSTFLGGLRQKIQLVECPRDAMQGWKHFIPTEKKIAYLNALLQVGFHTLDCGSFVSPVAIPQMADTLKVIPQLHTVSNGTKLLVIVANTRGAETAMQFPQISYIGFPFSISPTFQLKNTNSTIEKSLATVDAIQQRCLDNNKQLVVYLSMAFGNPYGDDYNEDTLLHWADEMVKRGIPIVSLADTVGLATPNQIEFAFSTLIPTYPQTTFGVHLHSTVLNRQQKLAAAYQSGCTRFDGALKGIGGCPMAGNQLVGNLDTEWMINYFTNSGMLPKLNHTALQESLQLASEIFGDNLQYEVV